MDAVHLGEKVKSILILTPATSRQKQHWIEAQSKATANWDQKL